MDMRLEIEHSERIYKYLFYVKGTKTLYAKIAQMALGNELPFRIRDPNTGMNVVFELDTSKEQEASSDGQDKGVPVEVKVEHEPRCSCEKCVKARMENAGLLPLDESQGITEKQFVDICDLLAEFIDYKFEKPGRSAIAAYVREMLTTLGLEYKG